MQDALHYGAMAQMAGFEVMVLAGQDPWAAFFNSSILGGIVAAAKHYNYI